MIDDRSFDPGYDPDDPLPTSPDDPVYDDELGVTVYAYRTGRITVDGPASFVAWWDWRHSRKFAARATPGTYNAGGWMFVGGVLARDVFDPDGDGIPF